MAKARLYAVSPKATPSVVSKLKGQAKIVMDELLRDSTPRLATEVDAVTGKLFKTRQDTLRVTLYYIIVFKGKGLVTAFEPVSPEDTSEETASEEYDDALSTLVDMVIK